MTSLPDPDGLVSALQAAGVDRPIRAAGLLCVGGCDRPSDLALRLEKDGGAAWLAAALAVEQAAAELLLPKLTAARPPAEPAATNDKRPADAAAAAAPAKRQRTSAGSGAAPPLDRADADDGRAISLRSGPLLALVALEIALARSYGWDEALSLSKAVATGYALAAASDSDDSDAAPPVVAEEVDLGFARPVRAARVGGDPCGELRAVSAAGGLVPAAASLDYIVKGFVVDDGADQGRELAAIARARIAPMAREAARAIGSASNPAHALCVSLIPAAKLDAQTAANLRHVVELVGAKVIHYSNASSRLVKP
jgi:hypothetical protein